MCILVNLTKHIKKTTFIEWVLISGLQRPFILCPELYYLLPLSTTYINWQSNILNNKC